MTEEPVSADPSETSGEDQPDNRWLGSYAALFTLLFALFVILYATSQADLSKLKQVNQGMKTAYSGEPTSSGGGASGELAQLKGSLEAEISAISVEQVNAPSTVAIEDAFEFELDASGVGVRILAKNFFKPGESEINPDLRPLMDRIAKIILEANRSVRIEGHADEEDSRILSSGEPSRFRNTWELSSARAAWIAQYWMKRFNFDPQKLEIAGFSKYRPLPQSGKSMNRRIEIVIH